MTGMPRLSALLASVAVACVAVGPAVAQPAEEVVGRIGGFLSNITGPTAGMGNRAAAQSDFFTKYTAARLEMNQAQMHLSQAFDLKAEVALLEAERATLSAGPVSMGQFRKSTELSVGVNSALTQRMTSEASLSAEATTSFASAIPSLVRGTILIIQLPKEAKAWADAAQQAANSGSMLEKARLLLTAREAVAVVRDLPGLIKSTVDSYTKVLTFGRVNKVELPEGVDAVLETGGSAVLETAGSPPAQ